jgi:hypothetical protein
MYEKLKVGSIFVAYGKTANSWPVFEGIGTPPKGNSLIPKMK